MKTLKSMMIILGAFLLLSVAFSPIIAVGDDSEERERKREEQKHREEEKEDEEKREREGKEENKDDDSVTLREFYQLLAERGIDENIVKRVFERADVNNDDELSKRELKLAFSILKRMASREGEKDGDSVTLREFYKLLSERGIDENIIRRVFERADVNDDDELSKRELKLAFSILRRMSARDGDGREREDNYISLREFISRFGKRMDDDKLKRIFRKADSNGDGELNRREMAKALAMMKCDDRKERSRIRTHFRMVDKDSDGVPETIHFEVHIDDDDEPDLVMDMTDRNSDGNPEVVEMESNLPPEMMMLIMRMMREREGYFTDEEEEWEDDEQEYGSQFENKYNYDEKKEREDEVSAVDGEILDRDNDNKSVESEGSDEGINSTLLALMISCGIILLIGLVGGSFLLMKKIYG